MSAIASSHTLQNALCFLALSSVKGLGPVKVQELLAFAQQEGIAPDQPGFRTLALQVLRHSGRIGPESLNLLEQRLADPLQVTWPERDRVLEWLQGRADRRLLALGEDDYPYLLRQIEDPPLLLYLQGDAALLHRLQLAIVGARRPTAMGLSDARAFAGALTELGWTITSGLAEGIDAAAHQGALQASGSTLAVLGTGLDRCYPARHKTLQQQVADQGLLVSEYPLGTPPRGPNFPRRNRIVSGLSVGLLVVEAALKSGSLISARLASEQGREVFAIPGSIHQAQSKGCHQLIKNGAKLTETVMDLHEELVHWLQPNVGAEPSAAAKEDRPKPPAQSSLFDPAPAGGKTLSEPAPSEKAPSDRSRDSFSSDAAYRIWQAVAAGAANTDQLVLATGLDTLQVSQQCLMLEMQGLLKQSAGCWQAV